MSRYIIATIYAWLSVSRVGFTDCGRGQVRWCESNSAEFETNKYCMGFAAALIRLHIFLYVM